MEHSTQEDRRAAGAEAKGREPRRRRPLRWVDAELATMDPETEYERMVGLVADYKLNDVVMNVNYVLGFMATAVSPAGARAIAGTGKSEHQPQTRFLDTARFFWQWMLDGPSDPKVQASLRMLNRIHANYYEEYPDSFEDNDDWLFTLCNLACGADRLREEVGAAPQPEHLQTALHHFWRDLTAQMTGSHGTVHSFPEDYAGIRAFTEHYEGLGHPHSEDGRKVGELLLRQFNERFLPRPLHPVGRAVVLAMASPAVLRCHGLKPPSAPATWLVHRAFQAFFFAQDRFLPDNRVPMREVLSSPRYRSWKARVKKQESGAPA